MADPIFAPTRAEPFADPDTGQITIRYATYFEQLAEQVTATDVTIDGQIAALASSISGSQVAFEGESRKKTESALSQAAEALFVASRVNAQTAGLLRQIADQAQLAAQNTNDSAKIAEMQKQIDELKNFVAQKLNGGAAIAEIQKEINDIRSLIG